MMMMMMMMTKIIITIIIVMMVMMLVMKIKYHLNHYNDLFKMMIMMTMIMVLINRMGFDCTCVCTLVLSVLMYCVYSCTLLLLCRTHVPYFFFVVLMYLVTNIGKKNKNTNRYDIFPTEINDDPKYSTFSPYEFSE